MYDVASASHRWPYAGKGANGLLFRRAGALTHFYEFDPMGNVVRAEDQGGYTLGTWSYDAYGNRTGSTPTGPYLYGGQWGYYTDWNTSTGLILCTHRYYDPGLGRWLTRDPIGYEGGINLYGYVEGNPISNIDPLGEASVRYSIGYIDAFGKKIPYIHHVFIQWDSTCCDGGTAFGLYSGSPFQRRG